MRNHSIKKLYILKTKYEKKEQLVLFLINHIKRLRDNLLLYVKIYNQDEAQVQKKKRLLNENALLVIRPNKKNIILQIRNILLIIIFRVQKFSLFFFYFSLICWYGLLLCFFIFYTFVTIYTLYVFKVSGQLAYVAPCWEHADAHMRNYYYYWTWVIPGTDIELKDYTWVFSSLFLYGMYKWF